MNNSSRQKMTIAQIAAAAGVSIPTVSKVINQRPDVAPATRERVERILAEHRFATNRVAHLQGRERHELIDLVVPSLDTARDLEIIRGIENSLEGSPLRLVLSLHQNDEQRERQWLNKAIEGTSDGVLIIQAGSRQPSYLQTLRQHQIPFVVIDLVGETSSNTPSVGTTNWAAGRAVTGYLLALGHRRIGAIYGPQALACARDRHAGYRTALEEAEIGLDPSLIRYGDLTSQTGYREACALLDLPQSPTAIITGNDDQAFGVYRALHERGITVPDAMSVIGFDDIPFAAQITPPLTTMRQPLFEMGQVATSMLLQQIEKQTLTNTRIELASPLIERASCAPPRRIRILWTLPTSQEYRTSSLTARSKGA